ncbi:MAG TPA: ATP-grasp fold amidoligase family protein [Candidatus Deferrimicrobiaceae bacterium]|nr:ATP-grasp fold amidoligase family protein [Candidatus Deferrimicrobiaceae bacterium]
MGLRSLGWLVKELARRARRRLWDCVPDRVVLARRYRQTFGRPLNLRDPRTFNEKLCWLMLYYRPPLVTAVADKYAVRSYVAERAGPGILNELYGVWDRAEDIDFDALPDAFVLKVNWGWRMNIFCRRKADLDVPGTRARLAEWLRRSYYWTTREWCYKNIKPRIICERLLIDSTLITPTEYGFHCFAGEPRFVRASRDRATQLTTDTFDLKWQTTPFSVNRPDCGRVVARPGNFDEMVECARRLSADWPFVRVDLYEVDGRTVFSELTLYPAAGMSHFIPEEYDRYWGDALQLPRSEWGWRGG